MRLPQLPLAPCELLHPQSHNGSDQVVDFTTFCTLILPLCRIRFTCAVCSSLPIASFRPCRYQQRPCDSDCLPPGQGDICFFQQTGGASHAGQTKDRVVITLPLLHFLPISFELLPKTPQCYIRSSCTYCDYLLIDTQERFSYTYPIKKGLLVN